MFKIDCRIEDKNIGRALAVLGPFIYSIKVTHAGPIRIPDVPKPKVNGTRPSYDKSKEMVAAELRKLGGTVNAAKMREVLPGLGFSPTSYSYFLGELVKAKMLKKTGKGTASVYDWPR